ncbi:MAG TPA: 3-dehydroquinate synthase [Candidatus Binatia bacterium]|jgi:3-dehydroquinate synthase|nr:3-dehydroquinate synthase [Candidatus Binatia bacterium]
MRTGAAVVMEAERRIDEVVVALGERSYPIVVGEGVLSEIGPRLAGLGFRGRSAVVTGELVATLYLEPVLGSLRAAGFEPLVITIPDGEEHKNLAWLALIYDRLLEAGIERRTPLVALGGGVIGDLTGFAAATLLRGLPVVQVPTTLLAMVDAAIGGKTAVNHAVGKNLIGAFHQPRLVLADTGVLRTLPRRELLAGLAEVIKYGVIRDADLFADIETHLDDVLALDADALARVIGASCRHKAEVVARDEREEGTERATLNYGHTVGHAVEMLTEYRRLLHGEAVAIGMVAAARVSHGLGLCDASVVTRIEGVLRRAGLPTSIPDDLERPALALAMRSDKKSAGGKIRFVAVEAIGRVRLVELVGTEIVNHF